MNEEMLNLQERVKTLKNSAKLMEQDIENDTSTSISHQNLMSSSSPQSKKATSLIAEKIALFQKGRAADSHLNSPLSSNIVLKPIVALEAPTAPVLMSITTPELMYIRNEENTTFEPSANSKYDTDSMVAISPTTADSTSTDKLTTTFSTQTEINSADLDSDKYTVKTAATSSTFTHHLKPENINASTDEEVRSEKDPETSHVTREPNPQSPSGSLRTAAVQGQTRHQRQGSCQALGQGQISTSTSSQKGSFSIFERIAMLTRGFTSGQDNTNSNIPSQAAAQQPQKASFRASVALTSINDRIQVFEASGATRTLNTVQKNGVSRQSDTCRGSSPSYLSPSTVNLDATVSESITSESVIPLPMAELTAEPQPQSPCLTDPERTRRDSIEKTIAKGGIAERISKLNAATSKVSTQPSKVKVATSNVGMSWRLPSVSSSSGFTTVISPHQVSLTIPSLSARTNPLVADIATEKLSESKQKSFTSSRVTTFPASAPDTAIEIVNISAPILKSTGTPSHLNSELTRQEIDFAEDSTSRSTSSPLKRLNISDRITMYQKDLAAKPVIVTCEVSEKVDVSERTNQLRREAELHGATNLVTIIGGSSTFSASSESASTDSRDIDRQIVNGKTKERPSFSVAKNSFQILLERLQSKDPTFTEVVLSNSIFISQRDDNFTLLAAAFKDNNYTVSVELCNVNMKDEDCLCLAQSWSTCSMLKILNVETNMLTGLGIEALAQMAEKHPSLTTLRIANQRLVVGLAAEQAIANALSQNPNITKVSHNFREHFISTYVEQYLRRNLDLVRQSRTQGFSSPVTDAYPYPQIVNRVLMKEKTPTASGATTPTGRYSEISNPAIEAILLRELDPVELRSATPQPLSSSSASAQQQSASVPPRSNKQEESPEITTEGLSVAERLALLRKEKDYHKNPNIPEAERMNMTMQERTAMLTKPKERKPVEIAESERGNIALRLAKLEIDATSSLSSSFKINSPRNTTPHAGIAAIRATSSATSSPPRTSNGSPLSKSALPSANINSIPIPGAVSKSPKASSKISNLSHVIRLEGLVPGARAPVKGSNLFTAPADLYDLKITQPPSSDSASGSRGRRAVVGDSDGNFNHLNLTRPTCIRLRTKTRHHSQAIRGTSFSHVSVGDTIPLDPSMLVSNVATATGDYKVASVDSRDRDRDRDSVASATSHDSHQSSDSHALAQAQSAAMRNSTRIELVPPAARARSNSRLGVGKYGSDEEGQGQVSPERESLAKDINHLAPHKSISERRNLTAGGSTSSVRHASNLLQSANGSGSASDSLDSADNLSPR